MILKIPEPCNVRPYNQRQMDLFPPSVRSLIADDHLCIIVNDVVNAVDLILSLQKSFPRGQSVLPPANDAQDPVLCLCERHLQFPQDCRRCRRQHRIYLPGGLAETGFSHHQRFSQEQSQRDGGFVCSNRSVVRAVGHGQTRPYRHRRHQD